MKNSRTLMWLGAGAYAISFCLIAANDLFGFVCAIVALDAPFGAPRPPTVPRDPFGNHPFGWVALFISGMINIVFPLAFLLGLTPARRAFRAARILVVLMIPFSWLVFVYMEIFPREGHFLWVGGMLLALFSEEISMRMANAES